MNRIACIGVVACTLMGCGSPSIESSEPGSSPSGGTGGAPGGMGAGTGAGQAPSMGMLPGFMLPAGGAADGGAPAAGGKGLEDEATCAAETLTANPVPVDIYIMEDRSGSMGMQGKWDAMKRALNAFVASPATTGLGVGMGFFPQVATMGSCPITCNDALCFRLLCGCMEVNCANNMCTCTNWGFSCERADYGTPAVPIEPLPGAGAKITAALNAIQPAGGTPTRPALEGAIQYARTWQTTSKRRVAVALATDGEPMGCSDNSVASSAAVARMAAMEGILTFVIGVGPALSNLNALAMAGGTEKAYLVEGGDLEKQLVMALSSIQDRASRLACAYDVPMAKPGANAIDPTRVNVRFTRNQATAVVAQVADKTRCGPMGGWYYDNPAAPKQILLCESSCQEVNAGTGPGEISILVGCKTKVVE